MNTLRVLLAIARADFLERVRRYSFLVTLAATAWLGWLVATGRVAMLLDGYRGRMNGAWAGALVAVTLTTLVSLVGFWIVKNAVERDRATRVGEILAATPLTKAQYTFGKFLSNFAVLATIVAALAITVPVLVVARAEGGAVAPWATLSPFLLIALPSMAITAACAVVFETVRPLSGGFGNVAWFFVWSAVFTIPIATERAMFDMTGLVLMQESAGAAAASAHPDYKGGFVLTVGGSERERGTFAWDGIAWTPTRVAGRLFLFGAAIVLALAASIPFDRFDESRRRWRARPVAAPAAAAVDPTGAKGVRAAARAVPLTPVTARSSSVLATIPGVLGGELRLMLKGRAWWFWAAAVGLLVAQLATPLASARAFVLPFAWIWPVFVWSAMGAREAHDGTEELVFSAPRPLAGQIPALYLAGVVVALAAGAGVGARTLVGGPHGSFAAWLAGACFVPALALALGAWSGTSKTFEALYTVLWYLGPLQKAPPLDFLGASDASIASGTPARTAIAALVLVAAAVLGRRRRLAR